MGSNWKAIGKRLESNWKVIESDWKTIGKRLESDWKAIGKRLESDWNIIENFWQFLEQFLANYSNVWQHLVIYGISCT